MSEMNADLKAAQQRILALKHNLLELEEAGKRTAERLIHVERRLSDANGEVLRLGLQLKHHLQLQAERDALAAKLGELEGQEPAQYEVRTRLDWESEWCPWERCSKEQADYYRKTPRLHDWHSEVRELYTRPTPAEMSPELTDTARSALLWVLWHHQGGSSPVGQPIRYALGMGAHDRLSDYQVQEAKRWAELKNSETRDFHRRPAEPVNARLLEALKQAQMALIGYLPLHRNEITEASIECACAAIAAAESAPKAVRLTDEEVASLLADSDKNSSRVPSFFMVEPHKFARAIETAVLRKNGLEVAE